MTAADPPPLVRVRLFAAARAAAGTAERHVPAASLRELVDVLTRDHGPRMGQVLTTCTFLVDGLASGGRGADGRIVDRSLPPGAVVDVLPPFAGG